MKLLKKFIFLSLLITMTLLLISCNISRHSDKRLLVAHAHSQNHPVEKGLEAFCENVEKNTDYTFSIYPNGQLGGNSDMIQMVRAGVLDIAKVSASSLEQFNSAYAIFSLPYVFKSEEHYFTTMRECESVKDIFMSTYDQGFIAIGWYDSGQRSIYTVKEGAVKKPADLNGLKVRTQDSPTSIEMIRNMGGSDTPMSAGEIYSALQQGIIDAAENNETVLSDDGHGEIAKSYTYTEHQYSPDIVIMSTETFEKMNDDEKEIIYKSMQDSWYTHEKLWKEIVERNKKEAAEMGVKFYKIDKQAFIDACMPQQEEFKNSNITNARYLNDFLSYTNK